MVAKVKVRKQGGSLAITLPTDLVRKMGLRAGAAVHLVEIGPGEFRLTPYDPAFQRALQVYERGARKYRNALHQLAK